MAETKSVKIPIEGLPPETVARISKMLSDLSLRASYNSLGGKREVWLSPETAMGLLEHACYLHERAEKGKIAIVMLRQMIKKEGIHIKPSTLKRDLGNLAVQAGVPIEIVKRFVKDELIGMINNL